MHDLRVARRSRWATTAQAAYSPVAGKAVLIARNHNNPRALYTQLHAAARAGKAPSGGAGAPPVRANLGLGRDRVRPQARRAPKRAGTLAGATSLRFVRTEDAYPGGFEYTQLAQHPAVVVVPYTKSVSLRSHTHLDPLGSARGLLASSTSHRVPASGRCRSCPSLNSTG